MIPKNTDKPLDARYRNNKNKDDSFFRYPNFEGRSIDSFNPPLNKEELIIKKLLDYAHACDIDNASKLLNNTNIKFENIYLRIAYLRASCMISIFTNDVMRFFNSYGELSVILEKDFNRKEEMKSFIYELNATLGMSNYLTNDFKVNNNYSYHDSYLSHLSTLCIISFNYSKYDKITNEDLLSYECLCSMMENGNNLGDIQTMHFYLGIEYGKILMVENMKEHYRKAFELAYKYKLYYQPSLLYYYYGRSMDTVLNEFPIEFINKIKYLSKQIHERYLKFMKASSLESIYSKLSSKDFIYIYFALQNYSNKQVAGLLKISESNVGNKYSDIYETLGIHSKAELINYYKNSTNRKLKNKDI